MTRVWFSVTVGVPRLSTQPVTFPELGKQVQVKSVPLIFVPVLLHWVSVSGKFDKPGTGKTVTTKFVVSPLQEVA